MVYKPTLEEWNWHILMLGQAMLGAVSNNFLQVSLRFAGDFWEITVVLERENVEDEEEIEDIADEASIFLLDVHDKLSSSAKKPIQTKIIVSDRPLNISPSESVRTIFMKRLFANSDTEKTEPCQ